MIHFNLPAGVLWLWLAVQQPFTALGAPSKDLEFQAASQNFFTNGPICQIHIEVPPAGIDALKKESRKYVSARVSEGTNTYVDVGVHLKGNSTFRPIDDRPSLTLKFNLHTPGQRFHGLNKISLNNSLQDPSYINEPLCTDLFRSMGVPVARISHARVWLNGRYLGVCILVEGLTKDFLKLNFKSSDGNLYEGNAQDIDDDDLAQISGTETDRADLKALVSVCQEMDAATRWQRLQKVLDVEHFIAMMAGEVLMSAWDGYYNECNNYRIYHDTATGRMALIPHGMDNMFQVDDAHWRPELHSLLGKAILQTSEGQNLYRERFWTAFEGPFRTELLLGRIDQIANRIRPGIALDGTNAVQKFDRDVEIDRQRVAARMNYLAQELALLTPRLSFGTTGVAKLANWQMKLDSGDMKLDQVQEGAKFRLHIAATADGKAAWFTRVRLDAGKYVFQGEGRTLGVIPLSSEPGSGAGLRLAIGQSINQLVGDTSWKQIEHPFEVAANGTAVELRCELRCQRGQAWFDADSLKLVRLR